MAKGIGLIGNFKGKVGNTVGYKLSASNTGNTQGIRVYQPIVRNPKTSAQAEQRAKLAPINATYRALKMIIDRGNEGLPYGNKSRLAWLKKAFKAEHKPWFVKGASVNYPVGCELTKGSLAGIDYTPISDGILVTCSGVTSESAVNTIGAISALLMAGYPSLKDGDQITLVGVEFDADVLIPHVISFIIDATSTEPIAYVTAQSEAMLFEGEFGECACAVIVSREGANGEHLRSTTVLKLDASVTAAAPYDATSKAAAIESYMSSASANADWAEESIQ
jgi:hypothetical protein